MADQTHIEWTDATWNVITGCSVVSPGCTNCYAMKLAGTRLRDHHSRAGLTIDTKAGPVWNGQVRFNAGWLDQPLRWAKPRRIFVCAHADLFHDAVEDAWLDKIFAVMALSPQHTFQILTKRPERMRAWVTAFYERERAGTGTRAKLLPNVWLGVSVEDQARANERIPVLLDTPAAIRWISAEPLLGPIDLANLPFPKACDCVDSAPSLDCLRATVYCRGCCEGPEPMTSATLDWVVVGGESGPGSRPMHPRWVRDIRDQCADTETPFLFKQWGDWGPVCELDTDAIDSKLYYPAPARRPEATRRPKAPSTVLHKDGARFDDVAAWGAYQSGTDAMLMFDVGKAVTGRTLQGVLHDGYPS